MFRATTFLLVTMYTYTGKYLFITFATEILWSKLDIVTCKKKKDIDMYFPKRQKLFYKTWVCIWMRLLQHRALFTSTRLSSDRFPSRMPRPNPQPPSTVPSLGLSVSRNATSFHIVKAWVWRETFARYTLAEVIPEVTSLVS